MWGVVCATLSVFLTTDALDAGGNSKIITSTASRSWCWESSLGERCSGKGNKIGGEWLRLVKAALWRMQFLKKLRSEVSLTCMSCVRPCPSAKDCPFVIFQKYEELENQTFFNANKPSTSTRFQCWRQISLPAHRYAKWDNIALDACQGGWAGGGVNKKLPKFTWSSEEEWTKEFTCESCKTSGCEKVGVY